MNLLVPRLGQPKNCIDKHVLAHAGACASNTLASATGLLSFDECTCVPVARDQLTHRKSYTDPLATLALPSMLRHLAALAPILNLLPSAAVPSCLYAMPLRQHTHF